jgi:hypothetical protein
VEYQEWPEHCYIVFAGVRCTNDTYAIDLFINQADPQPADATLRNQHYVGQIIRLGMGVDDDKGRCVPHAVTRVIDASYTTYALGLPSSAPVTLNMIVTDVTQQRILSPAEYQQLPGFAPVVTWGASIPALHQTNRAGQQPSNGHSSYCHPVE